MEVRVSGGVLVSAQADALPGIDESGVVHRAPAEVTHAGHVGALFVEAAHALDGEALERGAVAAAVREEVEQREYRRHARATHGGQEVVRESRAAVRGRDGGDREHLELARGEVRGEVATVETALRIG